MPNSVYLLLLAVLGTWAFADAIEPSNSIGEAAKNQFLKAVVYKG